MFNRSVRKIVCSYPQVAFGQGLPKCQKIGKKQLGRSALEGNDAGIPTLLEEISNEQIGLKNAIARLASNFDFDQILRLLQTPEAELNERSHSS